jgi:NUDIX domain
MRRLACCGMRSGQDQCNMAACSQARFAPANVFAHVRARLTLVPPQDWRGTHGDGPGRGTERLRPAAVLIGLAAYPREVRVILTRRNAALRVHSGQIAFPGGKIEAQDTSPAAAALRRRKRKSASTRVALSHSAT